MRTLLKLSVWLSLAFGAVALESGCGEKGPRELDVEELKNPVLVFQNGVEFLTTPRDGVIDYGTAYQRFTDAASLFEAKNDTAQAAKAHFNAAWTAEVLKQLPNAEKHYRAAYEGDAAYEKAMFSLARVLTEQGKHTEAIGLYKDFIAKHPDRVDVRNDLIAALSAGKMYDEAFAEAQEILLKDPKNAAVYRALSSMYYAQGNLGMSALCAEKSLSLNEGDPGTYNNLGVTFLLQQNEAAAIEKFKTALKLDPNNFEANMNLGFVALNSGDYALALACLQKAVDVNPQSIDAKLGLAVALRGTKDYTKSAALYDEVIKADPQNEIAYFNASTLHEKYTKDFAKSLKYLDAYIAAKAGQIGPTHEVFERKAEVEKSKAEEEARLAELKRIEAEKKAREERNAKILADLGSQVTAMEAKVKACPPEVQEEVAMMIEQANQVIADKDTSMAPDIQSLFNDYYGPMVDGCAGGAPAEPPTEGAPAEGTPAEGAAPEGTVPAEGTPAPP